MAFPSIHIEGGLIPPDLLDQIATGQANGQEPKDFRLPAGVRLSDAIADAWTSARAYWSAFQRVLEKRADGDSLTSQTRQQWVVPLLSVLGYEQVTLMRQAAEIDGRTYAISHRAGLDENAPPVHIEGAGISLDQRLPGRQRLSPHSLVQEYLNRSEHLWGVVTNGLRLRLIRDSALMSRQSYIEFDLETMFNGEHFADFGVLFRLVHRSRLPHDTEDAPHCLLEQYFQDGVEQGGRVREGLRDGVEEALRALGNGFLAHPQSDALRQRIADGSLTPLDYYRQLLRLIYRLLFLLVSEERGLIGPTDPRLRRIYEQTYSASRLRRLVEHRPSAAERYHDLWIGLARVTFRLHEDADIARRLGMGALDGDLFGPQAIPDLRDATISNADLLRALRGLMLWSEGGLTRRVNYAALDVEELGSVYESLLDFHPTIRREGERLLFELAAGTERKSTGSYYTRPELVHELIKSALEPVMAERLKEAGSDPQARERALLSLTVCDPACGSGHFLLAAARRIGRELASVRTGEAHPAPEATRLAVRDVIRHCIYGVDKNPLAVDLCKVALWLEGHNRDLPLSFLDHRIKCGDSLVGVFDLDVLQQGIPDGAYARVTGDDKKLASILRKRNKQEREGQLGLFGSLPLPHTDVLADLMRRFTRDREETPDDVRRKADAYARSRSEGTPWWKLITACHLWTAAFFVPLTPQMNDLVPTTETLRRFLAHGGIDGRIVGYAHQLAADNRFFHWPLEFPEVFERGGFDVVLGNPPWEQIQPEEIKFFGPIAPEIAQLAGARRKTAIERLPETNPELAVQWDAHRRLIEAIARFLRGAELYLLTTIGKLNTYSLFAELFSHLVNERGRAGLIVPTGIATDDTNKEFFADLMGSGRLISLFDFENRERLFPEVDSRYKFSLLTMRGKPSSPAPFSRAAGEGESGGSFPLPQRGRGTEGEGSTEFVFFATRTEHLYDPRRRFTLSAADLARINPNTRTAPVFRTRADADLTRKIYERVPVLINDTTGANPWSVVFKQGLFNMTSASELFRTREQLEPEGWQLSDNRFVRGEEVLLPLYEAKLMHQFDHRFATYTPDGDTRDLTDDEKADPERVPLPRYWVDAHEVERAIRGMSKRRWLLAFRKTTNATNERTLIASILPRVAVGDKAPLLFVEQFPAHMVALLLGCLNSLACDYVMRQKLGGTDISHHYLKQVTILPPSAYSDADIAFIAPRVLELVYTAWDMQPFAQDMGYDGPPFIWDADRRALLRAELDAYYAHLYGLTRDELRYILDPADVFGPDFPGETFRVLKEKEMKQYGEYRTRRLVLEAWERLGF